MTQINFGVTEKKALELQEQMTNCKLTEADLDESFVKGSGPGGQKVNKTSSCVMLKHKPTGIVVKMQKERSLLLNRFFARRRMCELLELELGLPNARQSEAEKIRKQKQRRNRRNRSATKTD